MVMIIVSAGCHSLDDNDEDYHGESNALDDKVDGDHDFKDAATSGQVIVILAAKICSMKFRKITGKFWFT